jgi:hypothetical protein
MAGLTPIFSDSDIEKFYDKFAERAEEKIIKFFVQAGEEGAKRAKENKGFNDITGNLRSSLGYAVVVNGRVVMGKFDQINEKSGEEGVKESSRLIRELAAKYDKGYVLILLAGMNYAIYVENMEGKDVIASSAIWLEDYLRTTMQKVLDYGG